MTSCPGSYSKVVSISILIKKGGAHLSNYDRCVTPGLDVTLAFFYVNEVSKAWRVATFTVLIQQYL